MERKKKKTATVLTETQETLCSLSYSAVSDYYCHLGHTIAQLWSRSWFNSFADVNHDKLCRPKFHSVTSYRQGH